VNTKHVLRYTTLIGVALLLLPGLTLAAAAAPAEPPVRLVIPGGATSGACVDWATACDLSYALNGAAYGNELWVKAGTYKPTTGSDRSTTFQLKNGVSIYGGFAGTEGAREQRSWSTNVTILSGDIGTSGNNNDNVYHVVTGSGTDNTALLDGFTVTGGNANSASNPDDQGGGMYNSFGSPTVRNVTFSNNTATIAGGGMYNDHSSPDLRSVTFNNNTSTGNGGAICNSLGSDTTLTDVTFHANSVTGGDGGALMNDYSSPTLVNVTFSDNAATGGYGGAMYNDLVSVPVLTNVTFSGNSATMSSGYNGGYGGAMYNYANTTPPRLTNVTFSGNHAVGYDDAHPGYGGALYITAGSMGITNTILWGNTPDQIFNNSGYVVSLNTSIVQGGCPTDSTCSNVVATDPLLGAPGNYGGYVQTMPLLPNSPAIDAANDGACPATDARGVTRPQTAHCDIGAFETQGFKIVIIAGDPQSTRVNTAFAQTLQISITAKGAGEPVNGGTILFDVPSSGASASITPNPVPIVNGQAGAMATANGQRGAYTVAPWTRGWTVLPFFHLRNTAVFYVKPGANGNCSSWSTACELQTALGSAGSGDEIWVAAGAYKPTTGNDRNTTFQIPNGAGVYGGFAGTETVRSPRNWATNITTLSGDIGAIGDSGDNVYHVVTANATDSSTALDGFTVTGGQGAGYTGGGVFINNGSLAITNCRITGNSADYGGGLFQSGNSGRVDVINSRIDLNTTSNHGGGLYVSGSVALTNTQIVSNTAAGHGGGVHANQGHAEVVGGLIAGNKAGLNGGGFNANNSVNISGTQFISNTASQDGGGLLQWNAGYTVTVTNARFERNTAGRDGGALWAHGVVFAINVVVIDNVAQVHGSGVLLKGATAHWRHTTFARNTGGEGSGLLVSNDGAITGTLALTNTILVSHSIGISLTPGSTALVNGVLWHNNTVNIGGMGGINVQNATTGDPAFATDGYHLTRSSLAIDHGIVAGVMTDIDGDSRPSGSGYDLGADEFRFKVYLPLIVK
jgi:hypothetical protein